MGFDIMNLLFALFGAVALFFLIVLDTLQTNDWKTSGLSTFKAVFKAEIRQLVQSLCIVIMCGAMLVQFCWYWKMPRQEEIVERVKQAEEDRAHSRSGRQEQPSAAVKRQLQQQEQQQQQQQKQQQQHHQHHHGHRPAHEHRHPHGSSPAAGDFMALPTESHTSESITHVKSPQQQAKDVLKADSHSKADMDSVFGQGPELPKWNCPVCSYDNVSSHVYCAMCETALEDVLEDIEVGKGKGMVKGDDETNAQL